MTGWVGSWHQVNTSQPVIIIIIILTYLSTMFLNVMRYCVTTSLFIYPDIARALYKLYTYTYTYTHTHIQPIGMPRHAPPCLVVYLFGRT